jgi:putative membrane-bound dehydrogenase-like protein
VRFGIFTLFLLGLLPAFGETASTNVPMPLSEVIQHITEPPGFKTALLAGEPDIRQPIAMCFDDRGRLWVVENNTYTGIGENAFDTNRHDRILIFEDPTGSGHFGKPKVFWDQGTRLTGIAVGFGGVYCTAAPYLIFIPDKNGDDIPDGPPEILLDGWNAEQIHHNIFNGLKWGPDGWLYGRQGISATSSVGPPGTPESERVKLNCAIWRYHPTRKVFEVFCQGGTNPWGHDWDQFGELFFVNTVIGHLFHGIPGAFYKRMFGEHLEPYRYGLMDQAADHYHWDTGKSWTQSRDGSADALGGGHAHSGLMIYMGDNWPEDYYGHIFMLNFHGRRINQDIPERRGSGYVAKHGADLVKFGDPWFQGIDLDYGPDGGVTVLDWSDTGECHGNDGVHRETGRMYKITYDRTNNVPAAAGPAPLSLLTNSLTNLSDNELLHLQYHPNEWYARHARRILQERMYSLPDSFRDKVAGLVESEMNVPIKLRLFFTLHAIGGDTPLFLEKQLGDNDEHVRAWAVRFLGEAENVEWHMLSPIFARMAKDDTSAVVRLYLASELQRMPLTNREPVAAALMKHGEDAADQNIPLMIWYGVEPLVAVDSNKAIHLAAQSQIPIVRQYIVRRLAEDIDTNPRSIETLLGATGLMSPGAQLDVYRGLAEALRGRSKVSMPGMWDPTRTRMVTSRQPEQHDLAVQIGAVFGDPYALQELMKTAADGSKPADQRRDALKQIIDARLPQSRQLLGMFIHDKELAGMAAHGLILLGDSSASSWALQHWKDLDAADQPALVGLMASRVSSAGLLLDAIARGDVPHSALTAFQARQISDLHDAALNARLAKEWGEVHASNAEKTKLMERYRSLLTVDKLKKADLSRGREVFSKTCAVCHKLYGEGASIGPDLTGGGRGNLNYLLENIIDPSAIVPADYRVSEVELKDGRDLSALIVAKTDHGMTLQTPAEKVTVENSDIVSVRQTQLSLMPEGLLTSLKDDDVCNLIAYLMNPRQVPLPEAKK